jgi:hypothetical protein
LPVKRAAVEGGERDRLTSIETQRRIGNEVGKLLQRLVAGCAEEPVCRIISNAVPPLSESVRFAGGATRPVNRDADHAGSHEPVRIGVRNVGIPVARGVSVRKRECQGVDVS